ALTKPRDTPTVIARTSYVIYETRYARYVKTREARMTSVPTPIPSRTQYVLEEIRRRILTGRLSPGQALVETDLAAQFGVSKTPVREALKTLAGTGLVVMSQYRGVTVRMVDADMAREVYDVRLLLEPEALGRAVRRGASLD